MAALYENERNSHEKHCKLASINNTPTDQHQQYDVLNGFMAGSGEDVNGNQVQAVVKEPTYLQRIIMCFSIRENLKYLLSTKSSPNAVPTINAFK